MPVIKSAKKALRVSHRRAKENLNARVQMRRALRLAQVATEAKEKTTLGIKAQSLIDRAAKKRVINKNHAARLKSRLAKRILKG